MNDLIESTTETSISIQDSDVKRSEISERITLAQLSPRDFKRSYQEALDLVSMDQATAQSCFYMKPQGNTFIPGPSVRLAEIIAYCWGNLDVATKISGNDGRFITAEAVCIDLQKNLRVNNEVKVSIRDKSGKIYSENLQQNNANAAASKALRNAIFRVIPRAIVNKLYEHARVVAVGEVVTLPENVRKAINFFGQMGIDKERIFSYFNVENAESITQENLADMIAMKNSIKEKTISVDAAFTHNIDVTTGEIESPHVEEVNRLIDGE